MYIVNIRCNCILLMFAVYSNITHKCFIHTMSSTIISMSITY